MMGPFSNEPVDSEPGEISEIRLAQMLSDIKRNSRNRRIAMMAPLVLAGAVLAAMLAAPPQHGGLALIADAESPDPGLPRVFGSNGVWRLAEPIAESPVGDPPPASVIEAPTQPDAPEFALSPPSQEELHSLPTSTSTPPTSTSGQSPEAAELDWSSFGVAIRIEPQQESSVEASSPVDELPAEAIPADTSDTTETSDTAAASDTAVSDAVAGETSAEAGVTEDVVEAPVQETVASEESSAEESSAEDGAAEDSSATDGATETAATEAADSTGDDPAAGESAANDGGDEVTPGVEADTEEVLTSESSAPAGDATAPDSSLTSEGVNIDEQTGDAGEVDEANPSTSPDTSTDGAALALDEPASIVPESVLVYSAHVSVTVQVVDGDSSVVDWCNTRVDWGDGSISRVAGADDAALCAAPCEYEAASSAASVDSPTDPADATINETIVFEHEYQSTIDASPRIFVATGDGCSYTLAELQLPPFTVVPLP